MSFLSVVEQLEKKLRPILTGNLVKLLIEIDKQIEAERKTARETDNFEEVQVRNQVRTAIINILDERDPSIFDNYSKAVA